jgi:predicted restriction endonuclease
MNNSLERISWAKNENAVEIGFEFYLNLLEKRIKGEPVSLVQELRRFFKNELNISLRETQARGLMHKESSVFRDYVESIASEPFQTSSQYWEKQGLKKFLEWKKKWEGLRKQEAVDLNSETDVVSPPGKTTVTINRIIRDNALSRFLKGLYDYHCQICDYTFSLPNGRKYAEGHHIRPLGRHHRGIDKETNIAILCPLHHAMFDFGVIAIHPRTRIILSVDKNVKERGKKVAFERHRINIEFLEYHLDNIYGKVGLL